jgi:hypothetical protein
LRQNPVERIHHHVVNARLFQQGNLFVERIEQLGDFAFLSEYLSRMRTERKRYRPELMLLSQINHTPE